MSKSKGPISKVNVVEIFGDPLQELIDICGSITVPDPHEFKKMLQNYQVVVSTILIVRVGHFCLMFLEIINSKIGQFELKIR